MNIIAKKTILDILYSRDKEQRPFTFHLVPFTFYNHMKRVLWTMVISLIWLLWTSVFATYEDFFNQLKTMGVDVTKIEAQENISRYDLSRLLNSVECKDCINPNESMIKKYVQEFWSTFTTTPGKDFADINFWWWLYNNISYYYCVAYVGDNTYMRWYPKATSPVCGGQFCGTKNTTTAEFIQVIINIIAKYIYKDLRLNRKEVNTRVSKLKIDSYEAKNFTTEDIKNISEKSKVCENTCTLQNSNDVNIYLKYCMFNLAKCSMQEIGKIKQWYWPVAELNLLYNQSIINIDQNKWNNTDKNIDGKTVIETLFKLNGKVNCAFNNDYDCDGRTNAKDSCPNTYNPTQKDTDKDTIGDVCDNDIDGDGIKNPIGIVDEQGKIDIAKRTTNTDNCLFVINTGQLDNNQNSIGDACENITNQIGLYISLDKLEWSAPVTTTFTAISTWDVHTILRDFGDGTKWERTPITHTFVEPGIYNVQVLAKGNSHDAKAQTIVVIWGQKGDNKALQTRASVIGGNRNIESTLSASTFGEFDRIEWIFLNENITIKKKANESIKRIFKQTGENQVLVKWYSKEKLAGISYFSLGIEDGKWAILKSNSSNPEINQKILFDTKTYNIKQEDILTVDWNFGDTIKISNTTLTTEYAYTKPWKKIVTQTITLTNGKVITNMITINIVDKTRFASYALLMIPSKIITNIGEKIDFSIRIIGDFLKTPLIHITEFWDGITQQKSGTEDISSSLVHTYQKNGVVIPQDSIYIDQCTYLKNQATIVVNGLDSCLEAKIQGTLNTRYKCDLDGDKIPDICDIDIDGDGIQNLLGLINFENKNCAYENNTNINQETLIQHYKNVCSLDNAPFKDNNNQLDLNQDGIGDILDTIPNIGSWETIDTDGDGIGDNKDICPTIQETRNSIYDTDWCPEIGLEFWCNQEDITPLLGITNDTIIVNPTDTIIPLVSCGNGTINTGETCNNCPQDVGICTSICGDNIQADGETCINCPQDIGICIGTGENICGNGNINPWETCTNCPQDIGICIGTGENICGNGNIDQWETCNNCPQDVKLCIEIPQIGTCNQCPCQFADFSSDLTNNDQVRAILRDKKKTIQYKFSLPWIVDFEGILRSSE